MSTSTSLELVNKLLGTLTSDLTEASKATWKVIVPVYQVNAYQHLVSGVVALIMSVLCVSLIIHLTRSYLKCQRSEKLENPIYFDKYGDAGPVWVILLVVGIGGGIIAVTVTFAELTNVWNWVALWNPQAYAVHEILNHVLSSKS